MLRKIIQLVLVSALALISPKAFSQAVPLLDLDMRDAVHDSTMTVSGKVSDSITKAALAFVNVSIAGSTLGTVTNEDGYFTLKVPRTDRSITVLVSHVGYYATSLTVRGGLAHDMVFTLNPFSNLLKEGIITEYDDPETLVRDALEYKHRNYPQTAIQQRGFYRETTQKGSRFINISEAVIDLYKHPYYRSVESDKVKIIRGRSLMSSRAADTISVKLMGGPTLAISTDVVKNEFDLFYKEDISSYNYTFKTSTIIEQRPQYVVSFTPRVTNDRYPLYRGTLFIDRETLAIMRAEYEVDMSDKDLVTRSILKKKPLGLRFAPQEVSFIVSYRRIDDLVVLNYVRNTIKFRCDWKKRLFSSGYTVTSEMVATDLATKNIEQILSRESFRSSDIFSEQVGAFSDPDFWGDYNIIEPTESLEHAVGRLKRRNR